MKQLFSLLALVALFIIFAWFRVFINSAILSSDQKRTYTDVDFNKWIATGPRYNKGKFKIGTEEIPYDAVMNPDYTGTMTLHLKDGTDALIKMIIEVKNNQIIYHYTNAAGDNWDYAVNFDEAFKGK